MNSAQAAQAAFESQESEIKIRDWHQVQRTIVPSLAVGSVTDCATVIK